MQTNDESTYKVPQELLLLYGYARQQFTKCIAQGIIFICLSYYDNDPASRYTDLQPIGIHI